MDVLENPDGAEASAPLAPRPAASLSVVLVCGRGEIREAMDQITPHCKALNAELVVVHRFASADEQRRCEMEWPEVRFLSAGHGATEAAMRETGVVAARGDVVALRCADKVGDGRWLSAFHNVLGFEPAAANALHGPPVFPERRRRSGTTNEFPIARERRRDNLGRAASRAIAGPEGSIAPAK
jgi:hypothetical protein